LENMKEQAKDPKTREAAQKELDKNDPKKTEDGKRDAKDAKPQDVAKAAEGLKSDDPKERAEAKKKREEMKDQAKETLVRDAAKGELEQAQKRDGPDERQLDPKTPDPLDLYKLDKDLQSRDPKKREQALKDLEKLAEQAKDPELREAAKKLAEALRRREEEW